MEENVCDSYNWWGLISSVYEQLKKLNNCKHKIQFRNGQGDEQAFFWEGNTNDQQSHEKMLRFTSQIIISKSEPFSKNQNPKCWWGCGEKGTQIYYWDVKQYNHCGGWLEDSSKIENRSRVKPSHPMPENLPRQKKKKNQHMRVAFIPAFTAVLFTIAETQNQTRWPSADGWI